MGRKGGTVLTQLPAYDSDPYCTRLDVEVLSVSEADGRTFAVLSDTIFYPEGGGQPADRGTINDVMVLDVQKADGEVRHFIASPLVPGSAKLQLDWTRRFDHMQQHTGQHLLTAIALDRFGWATTAFHLGEQTSDVELAVPGLSRKQLDDLEAAIAAEIRAARPVSARWVTPEEYPNLNVRSRRLPEGHQGDLRLVEIASVDLNTCCGTHVRNTAELELIKLLDTESLRGGTRVFFVVGGRGRGRLGEHEARNGKLRALLNAPDSDLVSVLETKLEQLRNAERRARSAEDEMADLLTEALAARPGALAEHHFEGKDAGFLQKTARSLAGAAPGKLVFFTASTDDAVYFVLAAGDNVVVDATALGKEIAAMLDAKGGGSGRFFQGKAGGLGGRTQAVERLREILE
jgi:alanyl-tRNA synthetase